ncbi:hypothetical protein Sjap_011177 [Stephania japonica]|uniref:Uncharacterized protein n=1 Tax=Stephania japonica TaxID=461633 RepID=A0AAP0P764_9MAGN
MEFQISIILYIVLLPFLTQSQSADIPPPIPLPIQPPIKAHNYSNQNQIPLRSCSYTVRIKTSCSSPTYTRDQISLAFGDAYGNQVYEPRLDDPASGAFERCSTDTYRVTGRCLRGSVCYAYLMRRGHDGWVPETVTVDSGHYYGMITFYYNIFLPDGVWMLANRCNSVAATPTAAM